MPLKFKIHGLICRDTTSRSHLTENAFWVNDQLDAQLCCYIIKGKSVPLQARRGPEGSWKLRFPDFVTTAQDGGRLSALSTGRLYPQEMLLGTLTSWNPLGHSRPVTGLLYLYQ